MVLRILIKARKICWNNTTPLDNQIQLIKYRPTSKLYSQTYSKTYLQTYSQTYSQTYRETHKRNANLVLCSWNRTFLAQATFPLLLWHPAFVPLHPKRI